MYLNVIRSYRDVVAVCDKELLGQKFEEGIRQLDVKENFYKGEEVSENEALEIMQRWAAEDATFNIVGHKAVAVALRAEIIEPESVGHVAGIPFVLVVI